MPASHACASCGLELARIRAAPDPIYALPIVVCPRCRLAVVRVKPRVVRAARRARRFTHAAAVIGAQAFLLAVFMLAISTPYLALEELTRVWRLPWSELASSWLAGSLDERVREDGAGQAVSMHAGFFVAATIGAGVWIASALAHWPRWRAHAALAATLALALLIPPHLEALHDWTYGRLSRPAGSRPPQVLWRLAAACLASALAVAGALPGRILLRVWRRQAAVLRFKRRRSLRKARRADA